jgi:hypothetical protein
MDPHGNFEDVTNKSNNKRLFHLLPVETLKRNAARFLFWSDMKFEILKGYYCKKFFYLLQLMDIMLAGSIEQN